MRIYFIEYIIHNIHPSLSHFNSRNGSHTNNLNSFDIHMDEKLKQTCWVKPKFLFFSTNNFIHLIIGFHLSKCIMFMENHICYDVDIILPRKYVISVVFLFDKNSLIRNIFFLIWPTKEKWEQFSDYWR